MDGFDPDELSSIFDAVMGGGSNTNMNSDSPFGSRARKPGRKSGGASGPARGRASAVPAPVHHTHRITFDRMAQGGTESLALSEDGARRTIEVRIPKAVEEGTQLRMRGAVQSSGADLVLTVTVGPHPLLVRGESGNLGKGLDLFLTLPLTIPEAVFGAKVTVPGVKGRVELSIPPRSDSGSRLRLRGQGLEDDTGRKGDLIVSLALMVADPARLTPEQAASLKTISAATDSPRTGPGWI